MPEEIIKQFMEFFEEGGEEIWEAIAEAKLKIPGALAAHRILELRQQVVAEFEQHINDEDWDENTGKSSFQAIIGYSDTVCHTIFLLLLPTNHITGAKM